MSQVSSKRLFLAKLKLIFYRINWLERGKEDHYTKNLKWPEEMMRYHKLMDMEITKLLRRTGLAHS